MSNTSDIAEKAYYESLPTSAVKDGEVTTTFEDVATNLSENPDLYDAVRRSVRGKIRDVVLDELGKMSIADILREAIAAGDYEEAYMLIEEMKPDGFSY